MGGAFQQATSGLSFTGKWSSWSHVEHSLTPCSDQEAYELTGNQYSVYGVQYQPGFDSGVSRDGEYSVALD